MRKYKKGPPIHAKFSVTSKGITSIKLELLSRTERFSWEVIERSPAAKVERAIDTWVDMYCTGNKTLPRLPLLFQDTPPYTRKVLESLYELPYSSRLTYKQLAELTGNPKGARAVGNACGRNPFPLVIPCHHVIAADCLGGYAFGFEMKQTLLVFESLRG